VEGDGLDRGEGEGAGGGGLVGGRADEREVAGGRADHGTVGGDGSEAGGQLVDVVVAEVGAAAVAATVFPEAQPVVLTRAELRPQVPFAGPLFALLGAVRPGTTVGLVVPGVWRGPAAGGAAPGTSAAAATLGMSGGAAAPGTSGAVARSSQVAPVLVPVRDHVNLVLRGPLTGRWPAGVPRSFPCMTGIYQPAAARAAAGAPIYSEDVVAAGVRDAARLTPFERRALDEAGSAAYADCLVPAVVVAAFYGLKVAACLVVAAADERE